MAENLGATSAVPVPRTATGQFAKGSGGRPRGSRNKLSYAAVGALHDLSSQAVAVLRHHLAMNDLKAALFILKAILPDSRLIELPSASPDAWANAMAAGEVTPDEASRAATALGKLKDVEEIQDLRARLDELETLILAGKR